MARKEDIVIDQGATFPLPIQIFESTGVCLDLTDYTAEGKIRHNFADAAPSASFTIQITDPLKGKLIAQLGRNVTAGLVAERYWYDIEITSGSITTRIVEGRAIVSPEVTK
jgi:hypothetical protein